MTEAPGGPIPFPAPGASLVLPQTGEVVNLDDEQECVRALLAVREWERQVRETKSLLTEAIVERSRSLGTKTLSLAGGQKVEVKGGQETVYDAQALEAELRRLGMPEERISEIITETVTYSVSAREAKKAAAANPEYAEAIRAARHEVTRPHYITVRQRLESRR